MRGEKSEFELGIGRGAVSAKGETGNSSDGEVDVDAGVEPRDDSDDDARPEPPPAVRMKLLVVAVVGGGGGGVLRRLTAADARVTAAICIACTSDGVGRAPREASAIATASAT